MLVAAATSLLSPTLAAAETLLSASGHQNHLIHLFLSLGLVGLFLVSIVDSSFVPLPIPGVTDIMVVLYAAQHENLVLLIGSATVGSAIGGYVSYVIAHKGGVEFLERHVPKRIFRRVTYWMEHHAIISIALPAILPPPVPLSPFVLAAGALKMRLRTFMSAFTISRLLRHCIAAALGVVYGRQVLRVWKIFIDRYGAPVLIGFWTITLAAVGFALWRLWKTSKAVNAAGRPPVPQPSVS